MQPSRVDRVIRRVIRASSRMASDPISAVANRQPNELTPNVHSPKAMNSFPTGGCTTNSPPLEKMCVFPRTSIEFRALT